MTRASRDDHGVAGWPDRAGRGDPLPDTLPDGRPWPRVRVDVLGESGEGGPTLASLRAQDYPDLDVRPAGGAGTDPPVYRLWLRAGDLLAPGALAALVLEAELSGVEAVAGLRVLFGECVLGLDVLAAGGGDGAREADHGDVLYRASTLGPEGDWPVPMGSARSWRRLTERSARLSRVGRPVLLVRVANAVEGMPRPLSIVALTDAGEGGGAGIAHRRLGEALTLMGHRVVPVRLRDESPAAAAEWTDRFPRTEGGLRAGGHDLILVGNLHGATRSGGLTARLSAIAPTAIVLHDLFALTGRCAHPKDCPVIAAGCDARCPTHSEYPQLEPRRIAGAFAGKRRALAGPRAPVLLANSDWTESRARALAPEARVAPLRLAFPAGVFRPRDRTALRRELGLPLHDVLVLFAAVIADAPDKGFADLVATMRAVARPGIGFVALGRLDDPLVFGLPALHAPGPIGDEETLARWYAACDVYLGASRLETLGQTPIEAGLCGTPTVAYAATGLTSAVLDGVTGLLVPPRPGALAQGLERLIGDPVLRRRLGRTARIVLESRFSHAACALSLQAVLEAVVPGAALAGARLPLMPAMLGRFAFARERHAGASGTVAAPARPVVARLRRLKHAVLGRDMPLWARRALYAAALVRRPIRNLR